MTHRGVRNKLFNVDLVHGTERSIQDVNDSKDGQRRSEPFRRRWKNGIANSKNAVDSHFQENSSQDHRNGCRRFHVGIWKPRVKRKHRHFHGKSKEKSEKDNSGKWNSKDSKCWSGKHVVPARELDHAEGVRLPSVKIECQNSKEHKNGPQKCVEKEFDRCI